MIYLICDRAFDIYFHMRYPLYFTQQTTKRVLVALWIVCAIFALLMVPMEKFKIQPAVQIILSIFFIGTEVLIVVTAMITYSYLYIKVRQILANSHVLAHSGNTRQSQISKFLLPCLIIATYLIFNLTGIVLMFYSRIGLKGSSSLTKSSLSEIAHLFWILGWISDGAIYIFLQKSVRKRLKSVFKKSISPTTSTDSS